MDLPGDPVELVSQNSEELNAIIAEIERTSHVDAPSAPTAAAARQLPSSLYEEMLRYQEEHAEEAQSLISGLQENLESGELVRDISVNSAEDAKPAAFPQGVFRQPISRKYFTRKSLIDSSSHSDMVPLSPTSASASKDVQILEQGGPDCSSLEGTADYAYNLQTELSAQSTADIIQMLLENERGEAKGQHSGQDNDETLARQLHDVFNGSWSLSRRSRKQLGNEEISLLGQTSGPSALVDGEDNELEEDRHPDNSLFSRRLHHNPVAKGGLPLQLDISQAPADFNSTRIRTSASPKIQSAAFVEGISVVQSTKIHDSTQQNLLPQPGSTLGVMSSTELFVTDRCTQSARSPLNVDELKCSLKAVSTGNDRTHGTNIHAADTETAENSAVCMQTVGEHSFSTHAGNSTTIHQYTPGGMPQGSQEGNNRIHETCTKARIPNGELHADSAKVYNGCVPKSGAFVESTSSRCEHETLGRSEGPICKDRDGGSVRQAPPTRHAHNVTSNDMAADTDGSGSAKQRSAGETKLSVNWILRAFSRRAVQTVRCQGCYQKLQAPIHYQLVHCPVCGAVSPCRELRDGTTAVPIER